MKAYQLADCVIDPNSNELSRDGHTLKIESRVMQMLVYFCENPRRVIGRDELIQAVWGRTALSPNSVSVAMAAIRQALGDDARNPRFIETHKKLGYRLMLEPRALEAEYRAGWSTKKKTGFAIAIAMAVVLAVLLMLMWPPGRDDAANHVIILEPIENATGLKQHDELAVTLGNLLIAELARSDSLSIRKSIPGVISQALSNDFVKEGDVAFLSGRLIRQEDQLILSTYLENRQTTKITWAHQQVIDQSQPLPGTGGHISKPAD